MASHGPTTRHKIRVFLRVGQEKQDQHRSATENQQAKTSRLLTQDQRLAWIKELLTGDTESLPYRVAGTLVLVYAQPLQQTPPLAPPRVGHHNRGSSRRAAFCAPSKHPLAVRYYEYGRVEYGGLPVLPCLSERFLKALPQATH